VIELQRKMLNLYSKEKPTMSPSEFNKILEQVYKGLNYLDSESYNSEVRWNLQRAMGYIYKAKESFYEED